MGSSTISKQFGRLVREYRTAAGLSQEEFASQCGLHRTYVGAIERGEKTVSLVTGNKLARALNVPLSQMIARLEEQGVL